MKSKVWYEENEDLLIKLLKHLEEYAQQFATSNDESSRGNCHIGMIYKMGSVAGHRFSLPDGGIALESACVVAYGEETFTVIFIKHELSESQVVVELNNINHSDFTSGFPDGLLDYVPAGYGIWGVFELQVKALASKPVIWKVLERERNIISFTSQLSI